MSKAFLRESDDSPQEILRRPPLRPPGTKNYLTRRGAGRLRKELSELVESAPPRLGPASSEHQAAYQRIRDLEATLGSAELVDPPEGQPDRVQFGATVTVRDRLGVESTYRIVGFDESDPNLGWVSWQSPIARALLNAKLGDQIDFTFPSGKTKLEILRISYEDV